MKLCECGCGQPTRIVKRTSSAQGHIEGQPMRYLHGHQVRARPRITPEQALAEGWWVPNESGICQCGCGERAPIASRTYKAIGHLIGQPIRFIRGHSSRGRQQTEETRRLLSRITQRVSVQEAIEEGWFKPWPGLCGCGCGQPTSLAKVTSQRHGHFAGYPNRFIRGHQRRTGVTPENRLARTTTQYMQWRESVFERDDYTCQDCGKRGGGTLHAHHIQRFSTHPELRTVLANGVTLCKPCHKNAHSSGTTPSTARRTTCIV